MCLNLVLERWQSFLFQICVCILLFFFFSSFFFFFLLQMDRTLQLAPTMHHQTEAMLAFMKKFSWRYFSMVTTRVVGSEDFFSALRRHERLSRQRSLPNIYGHTGFQYVTTQRALHKKLRACGVWLSLDGTHCKQIWTCRIRVGV